jgi:hypothetical protein
MNYSKLDAERSPSASVSAQVEPKTQMRMLAHTRFIPTHEYVRHFNVNSRDASEAVRIGSRRAVQ